MSGPIKPLDPLNLPWAKKGIWAKKEGMGLDLHGEGGAFFLPKNTMLARVANKGPIGGDLASGPIVFSCSSCLGVSGVKSIILFLGDLLSGFTGGKAPLKKTTSLANLVQEACSQC